MQIALLNLYYDNNYGGNLQRYALMTVLKRMGCDVMCLYIRQNWSLLSGKDIIRTTLKQFIKHYLLFRKAEPVCWWKKETPQYVKQSAVTESFMQRYIPHSPVLYGTWWLEHYAKRNHFDSFIVGSDQVWRKLYIQRFGLGTWFFDFLPDNYQGKRIAYGASFGVSEQEYSKEEQDMIRPLFNKFDAVSVREESGLGLLEQYDWMTPAATCVLDPTLLLRAEDYSRLIDATDTQPLTGKLLCYILDMDSEKEQQIKTKTEELNLTPTILSSGKNATASVEQWLRDFRDAEYVITDSYHGLLFSLIFHKPFKLVVNQTRGASRFESVERMLNFRINEPVNWEHLDNQLEIARTNSIQFLRNALK